MPVIYGISPSGRQYPPNHKGITKGLQKEPYSCDRMISVSGIIHKNVEEAAKTIGCTVNDILYAFGKEEEIEFRGYTLQKL